MQVQISHVSVFSFLKYSYRLNYQNHTPLVVSLFLSRFV